MRIGGTEKFTGDFCRGIGANGLRKMQVLGKRNRFGQPVNRRAGSEDEALDPDGARRLQQMQCPTHIGVVVKLRMTNRRPHSGAGREMDHKVELLAMKNVVDRSRVAQIGLDEP